MSFNFHYTVKYTEGFSAHSSSSKSIEISDTSALVSSLTRDLSQSPSQGSIKEVKEIFFI